MNIMHKLGRGIASARLFSSAALLAASILVPVSVTSFAQAADAPAPAAAVSSTAPVAKPPVVAFDGAPVYEAAFENLRDNHYTLVTPAARAAFTATWQHKHDSDGLLTTEKGTDIAIYEMMWSLGQRFDYYFPPVQTKAEHEQMDATMGGIGLSLKEEGLAKAIKALGDKPTNAQVEPLLKLSDERPLLAGDTPDDDTPAGKAHIAKGDRILAVNGVSVNGRTIDDVVKDVRGKEGTKVILTISHKGDDGKVANVPVTLTRAKIILHVVKTDYTGKIAHIRMSNFESQFGTNEMGEALYVAGQKSAGIVLDLRGNPGGSLEQVLQIAQMFIDEGVVMKEVERDGDHMVTITYSLTHDKFIMSAQSDDGSPAETKEGKRIPMLIPATMPVIVLIDNGSASASEILSGTLQANNRARIMGEASHGKGVGQVVVHLPQDRSMHVTSFEFFPGGVKMDWVGIVPDLEVKQPADADTLEDPSSDLQLNAAKLEIVNTAIGSPSTPLTTAEMNARRAELEKAHRADFASEQKDRAEMIATAEKELAKGAAPTLAPPTSPNQSPKAPGAPLSDKGQPKNN